MSEIDVKAVLREIREILLEAISIIDGKPQKADSSP
jgi:hypothetical protein